MNSIFITINNLEESTDGVAKKCIDQINSLNSLGFNVISFYLRNKTLIIRDRGGIFKEIELVNKYLFLPRVALEIGRLGSIDIIFLRNPHGGLHPTFLTQIVRAAHKTGAKVVLDVPHFPYDAESKKFGHRFSNLLHKFNRPFLRPYVDLISYTGKLTNSIWNLPSLRIFNAVDVDRIPRHTDRSRQIRNEITFIGVAHLAHWHGYDRLIKGIFSYKEKYNRDNVRLIVVGEGDPELRRLKRLVGDLDLYDVVEFTGKLSGESLNFQYLRADIGVDALGRHRSGNNYNCSIKSKEFAARGLPFIKSHQDDAFSDAPFVLTIPSNDEAVDILAVIEWYKNCKTSSEEISQYVHEFLTWKVQMKKILDHLGCLS